MGLTTLTEDGSVKAGVAQGWEMKEGGRVWEFNIGDGFFWHDGKPVSAQDLTYNFKQVEVVALDDKTIRFTLSDIYTPFPAVVSVPVFKSGLIGVGPYKLRGSVKRGGYLQEVRLEPRNEESLLPRLIYKFYRTEKEAKVGLKLGEVSEVGGVIETSGFEGWQNIGSEENVGSDTVAVLFFNLKSQVFKDKSLRQALAYLVKDKGFGRERVIGPVGKSSWAYNMTVKKYDYSYDKAIDLLKGIGEDRNKIGRIVISTTKSLLKEAERVASDWREANIEVDVEVVSSIPDDYQVLMAIQKIPADPDQYALWHSTQVSNISGYQSPRVDRLLEIGRKEPDKNKRKEIYMDFQKYIIEDCPAVFLFNPEYYRLYRDKNV